MTKEVTILLDKIERDMKAALKPYIGDTITPSSLEVFKDTISPLIARLGERVSDEQVKGWLEVAPDPVDKNIIHVSLKPGAPQALRDAMANAMNVCVPPTLSS